MQAYAQAADTGPDRGAGFGGRRCRRARWRPSELAAMILGFIVFWPVGLSILGLKIWQRKSGDTSHLGEFAQAKFRAKWEDLKSEGKMWNCGHQRADRSRGFSGGFGGMRSTGNTAFDDWRSAELARLEEERRKLEAAEKEFADYIDSLRRAKDREEFDRFMNTRKAGQAPTETSPSA